MKTQDLSNLVKQAACLLLISHKVNQKDENNNFKLLPDPLSGRCIGALHQ